MNAIFGILRTDGASVSRQAMEHMLGGLAVAPQASPSLWLDGCIALGGIPSLARKASGPGGCAAVACQGPYTVVSAARIHNRAELQATLGISAQRQHDMSDARLFLECYQRWGRGCPDRILGEGAFALWDCVGQTLLLATSHYWHASLYYYRSPSAFYFASSLKGLLALEAVPAQLNEFRLGQLLIGWNDNLGDTLYKDIHCLGPAHTLAVSAERFDLQRYWALEDTPPIRFRSDRDYVEAFREIYGEAVRCRVRSAASVGSSLSGGLDSGSVTALAARELAASGRTLQAFSAVPLHEVTDHPLKGRFGDESEFVQATARQAGNVAVNWIRSEKRSPLEAMHEVVRLLAEPPVGARNIYWILSMLEAAAHKGLDSFLIGQAGNATVSWKGVFEGWINLSALRSDLFRRDDVTVRGILQSLKTHLLAPALPSFLSKYRARRRDPKIQWQSHSPIADRFAAQQNFIGRMQASGRFAVHNHGREHRAMRLHLIKPRSGTPSLFWAEMGRLHGLWISDPTADKRVLEFCLSVPNDQFYRKGVEKYLFRRVMAGVLPEKVLWNRQRGLQAADLQARLQADRSELEDLVASFKRSAVCTHYLDVAKIETALAMFGQNNLSAFLKATEIVTKGILMGLFLGRFE